MLCVRAARSTVARVHTARAASTATVWGNDGWRYDKGAFREWVKGSVVKNSMEERQMYAFLAASFGDCDVDKDGLINKEEFDVLLEVVAALPRRFGFAPSWRTEYGTKAKRTSAREAIFDSIDGAAGIAPRGKISMTQFVQWAQTHLAGKAPQLTRTDGDVALRHPGGYTVDEYTVFLAKAVNNPQSGAAAGFYNYLLTIFIEADEACQGKIDFDNFNKLIDVAAKTPRFFQLAPESQDEAARKAMFQAMDSTNSGFITFRKFLGFVREHVKGKIASLE